MGPDVARVLKRLEKEDAEDRRAPERAREVRMYTLHPDSARLCHILVQGTESKRLAEIGVAHGYSTIWMADAARIMGGRLTSLEINPKILEFAESNVAEAGLSGMVDFVLGDATETIREVPGPLDFVLMDCWEWFYVELLEVIAPKLRPGGLLVADNVESGHADSDRYIQALHDHPMMETVNVPIGREIEVSVRKLDAVGE